MKKPLITEIENIETKRVLNAMNKRKAVLNVFALIVVGSLIPVFINLFNGGKELIAYAIMAFITIFYFGTLISIHATYNPMLETAKLNDKIRHEEKVRNVERDRHDLEKEIERLKKELELAKEESKNVM